MSLEMFGYGFGFVGVMLLMMQEIAPGKYQTAHYAFANSLMNLGTGCSRCGEWLDPDENWVRALLSMGTDFRRAGDDPGAFRADSWTAGLRRPICSLLRAKPKSSQSCGCNTGRTGTGQCRTILK